jgi:ADP-heptose:LPS heptosyltransferase
MTFSLPQAVTNIFVWHQGALGDVLLAGPALQAVAAHYPGARLTLAGSPEQLGLLQGSLPVAAVWSTQKAVWLEFFQDNGDISRELQNLLASFDLVLVFSPREQPEFLDRFRRAGIPCVVWVPSFPLQGRVAIRELQEERLRAAGLKTRLEPFRLVVPEDDLRQARVWLRTRGGTQTPLAVLAPGSGHRRKNWPLESYVKLALSLKEQYRAQVWWILGPAEAGLEPELRHKFPRGESRLLKDLSLDRLAALLSAFQLYVGNDSGVTHLAAALGGPSVAAIFGPSDPVIWAPPGDRTTVVASNQPCAPCTGGREIECLNSFCLSALSPAEVLTAIQCRCQKN